MASEPLQPAVRYHRIAIQQHHVISFRISNAAVYRADKTQINFVAQQVNALITWAKLSQPLGDFRLGRFIVDDDDT